MKADVFLRDLIEALDGAAIPYMLTGSFASAFHGRPRATQNIDLVVELTPRSLESLLDTLGSERFYASREVADEALRTQRQFNVIDMTSGWKADLIVRKQREFSEVEFGRRVRAFLLGMDVWIATAEDTIIAKLEWATRANSDRQLRDVAGIVAVQGGDLDTAYVEHWIGRLGLEEFWERIEGERSP